MNVIVNYPTDEKAIKNLNNQIVEFKAILFMESINNLNISLDGKKKVVKMLLKGLKSGKYRF